MARNMLNRVRPVAGHAFEQDDVAVQPYSSGDDRVGAADRADAGDGEGGASASDCRDATRWVSVSASLAIVSVRFW